MTTKNYELSILKAFHGDSFIIKTFDNNGNNFIILIDGGTASTFDYSLKKELKNIPKIDLLVLTHIDSDHIGGLIKLYKNSLINKIDIKEIWINHPELKSINKGGNISHKQANNLKQLIIDKSPEAIIKSISIDNKTIIKESVTFDIFSPSKDILDSLYNNWENIKKEKTNKNAIISDNLEVSKKDLKTLALEDFCPNNKIEKDIINASSISFLLTCSDLKILLLGDSRPEIIEKEIRNRGYSKDNKLECDFVKISHHGSKNNTSNELLELIHCTNYIISTNGGNSNHKHPSRETLARIIYHPQRNLNDKITIYTNYPLEKIKLKAGDFIDSHELLEGNCVIQCKNNF